MALYAMFSFSTRPGTARPEEEGVLFKFKGHQYTLDRRMQPDTMRLGSGAWRGRKQMDTLSNIFYPEENYVEIVRQDAPMRPNRGIALAFEFDENNGEYPYTPANAVVQVKDFGYGGIEFDRRDSCNYTGVSNMVSNDLSIEIDGFKDDTIFGRFSGLLLNGASGMAPIEEGRFKIRLYSVYRH